MNMIRFVTLLTAIGITSNHGIVVAGSPSFVVYFGEDLNGSEDVRLATRPNADNARAQFLSVLGQNATETFEGVPADSSPPFAIGTSPFSGTLVGIGAVRSQPAGTNGSGHYPISGNRYFENSQTFTINLTSPARALGFYCVDAGDGEAQLDLSVALVSGGTIEVTVPNSVSPPAHSQGAVLYYGIVANSDFSSVTISSDNPNADFFAFDDFTIGTARTIPTVTTWGFVILSILILIGGTIVTIGRSRRALFSLNAN